MLSPAGRPMVREDEDGIQEATILHGCRGGTGCRGPKKLRRSLAVAPMRLVIVAGLKLIVVPIDSTWMRHSFMADREPWLPTPAVPERVAPASRQSKWAGSTRRCTRTALVTAPFSVWHQASSHLVITLGLLDPDPARACTTDNLLEASDHLAGGSVGAASRYDQRIVHWKRRVAVVIYGT
jgi:hypothetical protein